MTPYSTTLNPVPDPRQVRTSRRTLMAIMFVCLAPVVASYATFYWWQPERVAAYGELLQTPRPIDLSSLGNVSAALRGKWLLAVVSNAECDPACAKALYDMRQVRTAQGPEMERIARLWVAVGSVEPAQTLLAQHRGLAVYRGEPPQALQENIGRIVLIDPRGYLMMRFPATPDPKRMVKDIGRLLKYSPAGQR